MSRLTYVQLPNQSDVSGGRIVEVLANPDDEVIRGQVILILQVHDRTLKFRSPIDGVINMIAPIASQPEPGGLLFTLQAAQEEEEEKKVPEEPEEPVETESAQTTNQAKEEVTVEPEIIIEPEVEFVREAPKTAKISGAFTMLSRSVGVMVNAGFWMLMGFFALIYFEGYFDGQSPIGGWIPEERVTALDGVGKGISHVAAWGLGGTLQGTSAIGRIMRKNKNQTEKNSDKKTVEAQSTSNKRSSNSGKGFHRVTKIDNITGAGGLASSKEHLFFIGSGPSIKQGVYAYDLATERYTRVWSGGGATSVSAPVVHGNLAYFSVRDAQSIILWISDGTKAGTKALRVVAPKKYYLLNDIGLTTTSYGVVFGGWDKNNGYELWGSQGTKASTQPLTRRAGVDPHQKKAHHFIAHEGEAFFWFKGVLMASNGTVKGTRAIIKGKRPRSVEIVNDHIYFEANQKVYRYRLETGLKLVFNVPSAIIHPQNYEQLGDRLYFQGYDSKSGNEPWVFDPETGKVSLFKDMVPGRENGHFAPLAVYEDSIIARSYDPADNRVFKVTQNGVKALALREAYGAVKLGSSFFLAEKVGYRWKMGEYRNEKWHVLDKTKTFNEIYSGPLRIGNSAWYLVNSTGVELRRLDAK